MHNTIRSTIRIFLYVLHIYVISDCKRFVNGQQYFFKDDVIDRFVKEKKTLCYKNNIIYYILYYFVKLHKKKVLSGCIKSNYYKI